MSPHKSDDRCQKKVLEMRINGRLGRSSLYFSIALIPVGQPEERGSFDCRKHESHFDGGFIDDNFMEACFDQSTCQVLSP